MGEILQDHFHHVLGAGIGAVGFNRGFFCHHKPGHYIIDCGGGAENDPRIPKF